MKAYEFLNPILHNRPFILITPTPLIRVPIQFLKVLAPGCIEEHNGVLEGLVVVGVLLSIGEVLE